jgi:hypothetical protein
MCLDIFNGGPNNNQPYLAECGNLTGQRWILTRTDAQVDVQVKEPSPVEAIPQPAGPVRTAARN